MESEIEARRLLSPEIRELAVCPDAVFPASGHTSAYAVAV
jgi:hypothetical protein